MGRKNAIQSTLTKKNGKKSLVVISATDIARATFNGTERAKSQINSSKKSNVSSHVRNHQVDRDEKNAGCAAAYTFVQSGVCNDVKLLYLLLTIGHPSSNIQNGFSRAIVLTNEISTQNQNLTSILRTLRITVLVLRDKMSKKQCMENVRRFSIENPSDSTIVLLVSDCYSMKTADPFQFKFKSGPLLLVHYHPPIGSLEFRGRERIVCHLRKPKTFVEVHLDAPQHQYTGSDYSSQTVNKLSSLNLSQDVVPRAKALLDAAQKAVSLKDRSQSRSQKYASLQVHIQVLLQNGLIKSAATYKITREKMTILEMLGEVSSFHDDDGNSREAAETQWLDGMHGKSVGAPWKGVIRKGASYDAASQAARNLVTSKMGIFKTWKANPDASDPDQWGGAYGKPCSHNEVAMQQIRPFAPLLVRNTRLCSRLSPAPGNCGFDGCLEFLRLCCTSESKAITVWDVHAFHYISPFGNYSKILKKRLLDLSVPRLMWTMTNLRNWTLATKGQISPMILLMGADICLRWGSRGACIGSLSSRITSIIYQFLISGTQNDWKNLACKSFEKKNGPIQPRKKRKRSLC